MQVKQFYNKNQFLITNRIGANNEYYFQSYNSMVAKIDINGNLYLSNDWDYSKTTQKHLYLFLYDYLSNITNKDQRQAINNIYDSNNKRKDIQKLIDNKIITIENL